MTYRQRNDNMKREDLRKKIRYLLKEWNSSDEKTKAELIALKRAETNKSKKNRSSKNIIPTVLTEGVQIRGGGTFIIKGKV